MNVVAKTDLKTVIGTLVEKCFEDLLDGEEPLSSEESQHSEYESLENQIEQST